MTDRLVTAKEVAEFLHVSESWVKETTRSGAIPHVKLGRSVRYSLPDVLAWLETCKRGGRPVAFRKREPRAA